MTRIFKQVMTVCAALVITVTFVWCVCETANVRVYYEYSEIEGAVKLSDGTYADFTDAEIAYVAAQGYTVKRMDE